MFGYLEKRSEKRVFYTYLHQFELTMEHLGSKVSRQLLNVIHEESSQVAQAFNEPLGSVSLNIISAAAWGTIYCLLGPSRMCRVEPEYREIVEEVEMELMVPASDLLLENSIYRRVYTILVEHSLCHAEVIALVEACMVCESEQTGFDYERV